MKVIARMLAGLALSAALGLVAAQDRPAESHPTPSGEQPTAPQEREPDVRALGDLLASFVKAYNAKDAKASATCSPRTPRSRTRTARSRGGATRSSSGSRAFSRRTGGDKLTVDTDSLRFLGTDLAIEEGTASLSTGPAARRYQPVQRDLRPPGRPLAPRAGSATSRPTTTRTNGWRTSNGCSASGSTRATTRSPHQLHVVEGRQLPAPRLRRQGRGRIALSGTQRIGWDAGRKQFRTWVFDDQGGFAEGLMSRDGDRWIVKVTGIRSDGQAVSATNAITVLGKDRLLWETFERTVGRGDPRTDRFTLVRRAPTPASEPHRRPHPNNRGTARSPRR